MMGPKDRVPNQTYFQKNRAVINYWPKKLSSKSNLFQKLNKAIINYWHKRVISESTFFKYGIEKS